jgi:hypothetical protein
MRPWLLGAALAASACSAFEPEVGPLQEDGAAGSSCSLGMSGYGTSYGAPSGQAATVDFCTADGGTIQSACDSCESVSCCAERIACYTDQGCSCADQALDGCLGSVAPVEAGSGDAGPQLGACWSQFVAAGSPGQARYTCLRAACAGACQIPD